MFELNDRVALVTGAARGLGQAIAVKLAEAGADVALCDLNAESLAETADKIKALGRRAACYGVNVANGESVTEGVRAISKDFGRIDILVKDYDSVLNVTIIGFNEESLDALKKRMSDLELNLQNLVGKGLKLNFFNNRSFIERILKINTALEVDNLLDIRV